jgi:hypothetical protein
MGKVITERERTGNPSKGLKTRMDIKWKGEDGDYDIPNRMSSSANRQHGYDAKQFTDVLGPIYRFLDKQVGRPWNKVHSELCEHLDKRKVTHAHVFTHIDSYVEKDVFRGNDKIWYHTTGYSYVSGGVALRRVVGLFVNPKNGLIQRQKPPKEEPKKKDFDVVKVDKENEHRRLNGIWFLVKLKEVEIDDSYYSHFTQKMVIRTRKEMREVSRKQLNKKELKKLGVENLRCICDNKRFDPVCPRHMKREEVRRW